MSDALLELQDLRRQVARLRFTVVALLGCALLFLALANLALITLAPRFELIFEEMLGSKNKLPALTKLVINYTQWFGGVIPYGVIVGVPSLCFALVLVFRKSIVPVIVSVAVMLLMIVHAPIIVLALFLPLIQIISGIGERAP
jgi:hypothetical protein